MCGIAGVVGRAAEGQGELAAELARMTAAIAHRGPDGSGHELFLGLPRPVALGHLRLAILDVSPAGRQPMSTDDGQIVITYNGEVYNFRELRQDLERRGHTFKTRTDTEVLLRLYQERGPDFVRALEGMFAFALLDLREKRLLLARDPIGVKPLFYAEGDGRLVFASEIKALLAGGRVSREPDRQAIADYFTFLFIPQPRTAFAAIRQLPPAHTLTMDLTTGASRLERYWSVRPRPEISRASFAEAKEILRGELPPAVRAQLVSDVPLGVFLSAGADSTIVAGLARRHGPVHTYTVVWDDPELAYYDEREGARAASRHLGTTHEELPIAKVDPFNLLDSLRFFDQPFANPTAHLMHLLSRRAKERITVALCGAGGDELFAGYPRYRAARLARLLRFVPARAVHTVGGALSLIKDTHKTMRLRRIKEFFLGYDADAIERFTRWTYFLDEPAKARLLGGAELPASRILRALEAESALDDPENRMLEVDVRSFLEGNLLEYTDRASMAASLEVRVPLLNHRFVETALNLPFRHKMRRGKTKAVFRAAFSELFAPEAARLPKRGFNAPLALYMRALDAWFDPPAALKDRFGDAVGAAFRDGVLNRGLVFELRKEHKEGKADHSSELFAIMIFDWWWSEYVRPHRREAASVVPEVRSRVVAGS